MGESKVRFMHHFKGLDELYQKVKKYGPNKSYFLNKG